MIIAIDGPAGAGKTTTAKEFARKHGYTYVDTGAMYRATAIYMMENRAATEEEVKAFLPDVNITFRPGVEEQEIFLNGENVTGMIRTEEVSQEASRLSALPCVREHLLKLQRSAVKYGDIIMEGRDIGSVVFPDADLKIFLTAPLDIRVSRRVLQYWSEGREDSYRTVYASMQERDARDVSREVSPLIECEDAIHINTENMDVDSVVSHIWYLAEPRKCLETAIEDFDKKAIEFQYKGGSGKMTPLVVNTMLHELSAYKELGISEYEVELLLKNMTKRPGGNCMDEVPEAAVIPVAGRCVEIGPPVKSEGGKACYTVPMSDHSTVQVSFDPEMEDGKHFLITHQAVNGTNYKAYAQDIEHAIIKLSYYMTSLIGRDIYAENE